MPINKFLKKNTIIIIINKTKIILLKLLCSICSISKKLKKYELDNSLSLFVRANKKGMKTEKLKSSSIKTTIFKMPKNID